MLKHLLLISALSLLPLSAMAEAPAKEPIKIGEMHAYSMFPDHIKAYRQGIDLAVEEINATGGILGRPLVVLKADDKNDPAEAVRIASDHVFRERVFMLAGAGSDSTGPAVAEFARQNKVPFLKIWGGDGALVWDHPNPYQFRYGETTQIIAAIYAEQAAKLPAKKWAILSPTIVYGKNMAAAFTKKLRELRPDVEITDTYFYKWDSFPAGEIVQAINRKKPDGVFIQMWDAHLTKFIRAGKTRNFFEGKSVIADWIGLANVVRMVGDDLPEGWYTCGYPTDIAENQNASMAAFNRKVRDKFSADPDRVHFEGYVMIKLIEAAMKKAGRVDREAFMQAMRDLRLASPLGELAVRAVDQQIAMGCWFGHIKKRDGKTLFADYEYIPAEQYMPSDAEIRAMNKDVVNK